MLISLFEYKNNKDDNIHKVEQTKTHTRLELEASRGVTAIIKYGIKKTVKKSIFRIYILVHIYTTDREFVGIDLLLPCGPSKHYPPPPLTLLNKMGRVNMSKSLWKTYVRTNSFIVLSSVVEPFDFIAATNPAPTQNQENEIEFFFLQVYFLLLNVLIVQFLRKMDLKHLKGFSN